MDCPKCSAEIVDKRPVCQKCGFNVDDWDILFPDLPDRTGFVNDWASLLEEDEKKELEQLCQAYFEERKSALVLVTIESTAPLTPSQFVFWLFDEWGIGGEASRGLLILLSLKERRLESEVGYGLEPFMTDQRSENILNRAFVPLLKEGKWGKALKQGAQALIKELNRAERTAEG